MSALAKLAFTTDTTIFRIEKTGVVSDESLAHMLSDVLKIPVDKLYMKKCQEEEAKAEWERNLKEVFLGCMAGTFIVFIFVYIIIYSLTAKIYYNIVKK